MKIVTVIGARPQFIKAWPLSTALRAAGCFEFIIHTGQHYDYRMSEVFFEQLGIPHPDKNLEVGSGPHGRQTGLMLDRIEQHLIEEKPNWLLVYGDTNSTLAGALAAAKLHIPVAHVEAGLRSFNRQMPEEVNRILTDHTSALLFAPTRSAMENLAREGLAKAAHHVGDVMYDAALAFSEVARTKSSILGQLSLASKGYALATVHRAENTDDPARLAGIFEGLERISRSCRVILPLHPRTKGRLGALGISVHKIELIEPVSYLDMISLERNAQLILTDSGGIQKEAYFHGVPCVTLREETEWIETVTAGWNQLAGADPARIMAAFSSASPGRLIDDYGGGVAARRIAQVMLERGA